MLETGRVSRRQRQTCDRTGGGGGGVPLSVDRKKFMANDERADGHRIGGKVADGNKS